MSKASMHSYDKNEKSAFLFWAAIICIGVQSAFLFRDKSYLLGNWAIVTLGFLTAFNIVPIVCIRFYNKHTLAAYMFCFSNALFAIILLYKSGGIYAPGLSWLILMAPGFGILINQRSAMLGAFVGVVVLLGFTLFSEYIPIPEYLLVRENIFISQVVNNFSIILFTYMFLIIYLRSVERYKKLNQKKLSEIDTLLKLILHDISSPVNVLGYNISKVNKHIPEGSEKSRIERSLKSIELILEQVKNMRLMAYDGLKPTIVPISVDKEIEFCINLFKDQANLKNIDLVVQLGASGEEIDSDPNILKFEIIANLLSNAIKFCPKNGTVRISSYVEPQYIVIQIDDEGCGVPRSIVHAINNEEEVGSSTGTSGEQGQGFGLKITKKFIELLGGELQISPLSSHGKGTRVTVLLPR